MDFTNYKKIYLSNELDWNTPIMRYTSIQSLEQILELKFFVQERNQFDKIDGHENGTYEEKGLGFPFSQIEKLNVTQRKEKEKILEQLWDEITKSYNTLTSCWTLSQKEKPAMWFGKEVLIKSTIGKFLLSLDMQNISSTICGKVRYSEKEQMKSTIEQFLFLKEGEKYKHEEELRFYIDSDLRNGIDIKAKENNKSALLPLNGYTFIDTIVFNPLLSENQVVLKNNLLANYPQITKLIKESNI
ncbi:MAG: hypothetical protein PUD22_09040 [Erysipelotrichaceae bacterium]|nr:hypothetical protein [Erysipelotrichaceae bacterium]